MRVLLILVSGMFFIDSIAQSDTSKTKGPVELLAWIHQDCQSNYNDAILQERISALETEEGITYLTISFVDNCCAEFAPLIRFEDKQLHLLPYEEPDFNPCYCNCCFSIRYEIKGLENRDYTVFFRGDTIERQDYPFILYEPSFEIYKGDTINRSNQYGFHEGIWLSFKDSGAISAYWVYPDKVEDDPWKRMVPQEYKWSVNIDYRETGVIQSIRFYKKKDTEEDYYKYDEYTWTWDTSLQLSQTPENWEAPYPWEGIPAIEALLVNHELP